MMRFNSIEEKKAWYRAYYKANRDHLRKMDNERHRIKSEEKRKRKHEGKHPLLITKGSRDRKGIVKICPQCNQEFYVRSAYKNKLCCNDKCTKKLLSGKEARCMVCRTMFKCSDSQLIQRNRKTCSRNCRGIMSAEIAAVKRSINPLSVKSVDRCLRYSTQMDDWRKGVFERDNYTCQECGDRNNKGRGGTVYLEAHHLKQFATHPELRFEISNGVTLCKPCHKKVPHERNVSNKRAA